LFTNNRAPLSWKGIRRGRRGVGGEVGKKGTREIAELLNSKL